MTDVAAEANHGRWLVRCPLCNSAELASGNTWLCTHCSTSGAVLWPAFRADVDTVLGKRPVPASRNWRPAETVADLQAENVMRGLDASL